MPFGLKNAPQIFQRKMDNIFGEYKNIVVDILSRFAGNHETFKDQLP